MMQNKSHVYVAGHGGRNSKKKAAIKGSPEIFMQALCFAFPFPRNGVSQ